MEVNRTDRLLAVYDILLATYGPQHWWPGDSSFEIMVGAVLTQATAWTNVEKAISNLRSAEALTPHGIRLVSQDELAGLIYSSGYYNAKARKLHALAQFLGDPVPVAAMILSTMHQQQWRLVFIAPIHVVQSQPL